jgi:hypothetical protein
MVPDRKLLPVLHSTLLLHWFLTTFSGGLTLKKVAQAALVDSRNVTRGKQAGAPISTLTAWNFPWPDRWPMLPSAICGRRAKLSTSPHPTNMVNR